LGIAIDSSKSADLIARYKEVTSKLSPDALMASYASTLEGGDVNRGRNIFYRNQNAQCLKCHSFDDYGGNAGPRLNGVGKRLTRQQILESMIAPSARLAPGFGVVTLTLKDGKTTAGILKEENATSYILKGGDQPDEVIAKTNVTKRVDAPSSMLDMKPILSKKEIRDLVSFLSGLKEDK
jgi:putative heme-binding domain-containing protein